MLGVLLNLSAYLCQHCEFLHVILKLIGSSIAWNHNFASLLRSSMQHCIVFLNLTLLCGLKQLSSIAITWLILPVVICLSQRLSHACPSINSLLWNCEKLIKTVTVHLMMKLIWITVAILQLIHAYSPDFLEGWLLLVTELTQVRPGKMMIHNKWTDRMALAGDGSFKFLTYQLPTVGYWPTMAMTGDGELGFDSGEGAWETATTSKEGSRRANYTILTQGGSDKK